MKKTAKKATKKVAQKKAKAIADAFDSAMEPDVVPVPPVETPLVATEPMITSNVFALPEEDDFNEFAPTGMTGYGWADGDPETGPYSTPEPEAVEPVPAERPVLPSAEPVERVEPPARHIVPEPTPEPVSDVLIIERLINAINYLAPIAKLTKGAKGPEPRFLAKIASNITKARDLIERIK